MLFKVFIRAMVEPDEMKELKKGLKKARGGGGGGGGGGSRF